MNILLSCRDPAHQAVAILDLALNNGRKLQVRLYLLMCSGYSTFMDQMRKMRRPVKAESQVSVTDDAKIDDILSAFHTKI
jgi:hypothetical protein